jgi:hypothetical protein
MENPQIVTTIQSEETWKGVANDVVNQRKIIFQIPAKTSRPSTSLASSPDAMSVLSGEEIDFIHEVAERSRRAWERHEKTSRDLVDSPVVE